VQVPQHPFPRSVDWQSGADSMATSFPRSYTPKFFLTEIRWRSSVCTTFACKCRALNSNYCCNCRSDARDAT
jgi:hypothetical protein